MDALGINLGFFLGQLINFVAFAGLMYLFAWKPLLNFLDERSQRIEKGLEDARVAEAARANAEAEAKKILDDARSESQKLVADARASAEERAQPIIQAAEEEANRIRTDAQQRAEEARNAALGDVRGQVVNLAMAAADNLIGKSLSEEQQSKIVTDFFTEASDELKNLSGDLVVTTALPLSDDEKKKLEGDLGGTVVEWRVDPNILGGIVVRAGDRVVDGSVRSGLSNMAASLN